MKYFILMIVFLGINYNAHSRDCTKGVKKQFQTTAELQYWGRPSDKVSKVKKKQYNDLITRLKLAPPSSSTSPTAKRQMIVHLNDSNKGLYLFIGSTSKGDFLIDVNSNSCAVNYYYPLGNSPEKQLVNFYDNVCSKISKQFKDINIKYRKSECLTNLNNGDAKISMNYIYEPDLFAPESYEINFSDVNSKVLNDGSDRWLICDGNVTFPLEKKKIKIFHCEIEG